MDKSIHEIVRDAEDNYLHGITRLGEYVDFDMHDVIEKTTAYLNSKHISGSTDSLGREKPFFNIVSAARNIWYRATDIDRKNITMLPSKANQTAMAFMANVLMQNWMKKARFGVFLNDWGRTLADHGSAVVKFVEQGGELKASVVPWNRLIVDPVDFDSIPTIEKIYMTPAQLRAKKEYNQDIVEGLIESAQQGRETLDGDKKDNLSGYIEIYEVHGMLPVALLKEEPSEADEENYVQQMHVVSYTKSGNNIDDFTLFKGREAKHPYMLTHLIREDGRTLGIGAVEYLFDAQWMINHSVKNMKDTLDISSKIIMQTADPNYAGRNVLSAIETGDIFVHEENKPLTRLANDKPDIVALQNYGTMWQNLAQEITSTPDALRGTTLPSGTPYSLGAFLGGQAGSLFEIMTENKGLHLEDMMREYIIPHILKKLNTKEEVVAILDDQGIAEIDAMFVPREAVRRFNENAVEAILEGEIPPQFNQEQAEQGIREELAPLGNKRFFKPDDIGEKTWKEALKDFDMTVTVEVTNENTDKQAILTTLGTVLQSIAGNPGILQDPNARLIFNQILKETSVISPIQLSTAQVQPPAPPQGNSAEGLVNELPNSQTT